MPTVKVGDINMYYEDHGSGEPLLLIAGWCGDLNVWQFFQVPEFSKKYRVITFDNRGAGRTDAPDQPYSIKMMAKDTIGLMDALGVRQAHVLGHSMGGYIAQAIAIEFPARIKSLILASTTAAAGNCPASSRHTYQTLAAAMADGVSPRTMAMMKLPTLVTSQVLENPEIAARWIETLAANPYPPRPYTGHRQADACKGFDARGQLKHVGVPTLVIVGREDTSVPVNLSEELARLVPRAKLFVLDGGAHGFFAEIPDKFNQVVLEFLAQVA